MQSTLELITANPVLAVLISTALAVIGTVLAQRILHKRGSFNFTVHHERVGVSGADVVFGSVQVLWNNNPVQNLHVSTVELTNESLRDYEDVVVEVFGSDTTMLGERTDLVGTSHIAKWTPEYQQSLNVPQGQQATAAQLETYVRRREYLLSTVNRGQVVRFTYLTTTTNPAGPSLWLDTVHPGLKLRYRRPHLAIWGVPQPHAALAGLCLAVPVVVVVGLTVDSVWMAATVSMVFGFVAQLPGAAVIHAWRWVRAKTGD